MQVTRSSSWIMKGVNYEYRLSKEKERIELKNSQYVGSIGIYMEYSEKIEDTSFKYYFYNGIEPEEAINFTTAMFSSLIEEQMNGQKA